MNDFKHLLALYEFHDRMNFPAQRVNVEFVNLDDVGMIEFFEVNKLKLDLIIQKRGGFMDGGLKNNPTF